VESGGVIRRKRSRQIETLLDMNEHANAGFNYNEQEQVHADLTRPDLRNMRQDPPVKRVEEDCVTQDHCPQRASQRISESTWQSRPLASTW